jgi:hypothetical protein
LNHRGAERHRRCCDGELAGGGGRWQWLNRAKEHLETLDFNPGSAGVLHDLGFIRVKELVNATLPDKSDSEP